MPFCDEHAERRRDRGGHHRGTRAVTRDVTDDDEVAPVRHRLVPPPVAGARIGGAVEAEQLHVLRGDLVVLRQEAALHGAGELEVALDDGEATFALGALDALALDAEAP